MRRLLFFGLICFCMQAKAQLMDWGTPQKVAARNFYCRFIGFNTDGYYYLRCRKPDFKSEVSLEKYSRTLTMEWSRQLNSSKVAEVLQKVMVMDRSIVVIRSQENYATGYTELSSRHISFDGDDQGGYNILFQIRSSSFYEDADADIFSFTVDQQANRFAISYVLQAEKKRAQVAYNVYGEEGSLVSSGGYPYAGKSSDFFLSSLMLKDGHLFALSCYHDESKKTPEEVYNYDVLVFSLENKDKISLIPLSMESKIQSDIEFYLDTARNKMLLVGFYSEKKSTSAAGVVFYTMPLDSPEKLTASFTPFSKELLTKIIGEKGSDKEKEMQDFVVHRLVPRSDGGIILVSECFYIEKQPYNSFTSGVQGIGAPQPMVRNVYNYDEVLVFSLNADGSVDWWQAISKNQNSVNDGGYNLSIATLVKKEHIHIFFNLNNKNSNEIMEYSISNDGKMTDKILLKSANYYIDFAPRQSRQIASGSILMPVMKDRKFNLLKLTY
jgi:hypothetical protein